MNIASPIHSPASVKQADHLLPLASTTHTKAKITGQVAKDIFTKQNHQATRSLGQYIFQKLEYLARAVMGLFLNNKHDSSLTEMEIMELPFNLRKHSASKLRPDEYDVMIIGAGPVGITTACVLKALNSHLRICVVDKRVEAQRDHGLSINSDSVAEVTKLLDDAIQSGAKGADANGIEKIKNIFKKWDASTVRTKEIENTLADAAKSLNVSVLRGEEYGITENSIKYLLDMEEPLKEIQITDKLKDIEIQQKYLQKQIQKLGKRKNIKARSKNNKKLDDHLQTIKNDIKELRCQRKQLLAEQKQIRSKKHHVKSQHQTLKRYFNKAKVIIGADGAHSLMRSHGFGGKLVDDVTMQHVIELKFDVSNETRSRGVIGDAINSMYDGNAQEESFGKVKEGEKTKPGTLRFFTDEKTFESIRQSDKKGLVKGDFKNPWKLEELKKQAKNNPQMQRVLDICERYLADVKSRGNWQDEKITALPIRVFRSENIVKVHKGKVINLVGDASSGLVLREGFNKGLKEAALCAKATSDYFNKMQSTTDLKGRKFKASKEVPEEFRKYEKKAQEIFKKRFQIINFKNTIVSMMQVTLSGISTVIHFFKKMSG